MTMKVVAHRSAARPVVGNGSPGRTREKGPRCRERPKKSHRLFRRGGYNQSGVWILLSWQDRPHNLTIQQDSPTPNVSPMKSVSRFEANLLRILSFFLG